MNTTFGARRPLAMTAVALAAIFTLSACSEAEESKRDEETGAITEKNDKASVFDMKIGDCFDLPAETSEVETLPAIPCADEHDLEVYHELDLEDGDFPGDTEVQTAGDEACTAAFADFIGLDYDSSTLDFFAFYPTQQSWEQGDDRVVTCLAGDPAAKSTGTLEGAAR